MTGDAEKVECLKLFAAIFTKKVRRDQAGNSTSDKGVETQEKTRNEQIKQYLDKLDLSNWLGQIQFVLRYPPGLSEAISEPLVIYL